MATSGTYNFRPSISDLILDAYSRIQIRPTNVTQQQMRDAYMSLNLLQAELSVKFGINMWSIETISIPLTQGVSTYSLPTNVIENTDYFIRQYYTGNPVNLAPNFSTAINTPTVTVGQPNHGMVPGAWIGLVIQVSVGGLCLFGFYQVTTVINTNTYTITATSNATSTVNNGGVVPVFASTLGSTTITVTLPNYGLVANQYYEIPIATSVGGQILTGSYQVLVAVDANTFTFIAANPGGFADSQPENGGLCQIVNQIQGSQPFDRVILPISRTEYQQIPNKSQQATSTSVWWNRQIPSGQLVLWPVPDAGPYQLYVTTMTQLQDANAANGQTPNIPYSWLEVYVAGLAYKLSIKYPPPQPNSVTALKAMYEESYRYASANDSEDVSLYIIPGLGSYGR